MRSVDKMFWQSGINDIKRGYCYDEKEDEYICLICGKCYTKGIIYPFEGKLYEAEKAVKKHIKDEHGSTFDYLVNMSKKYTGLTNVQKELLTCFFEGLSDKEIVGKHGSGSTSTIRNHRFRLKEKEKQAKVFLAIMDLLREKDKNETEFISIHKGAKMVDERYAITKKEKKKVLKNYFEDEKKQTLKTIPSKEKKKIIVLQHIIKHFDRNRRYTEKEVNEILISFYEDYVTLRRYLIEYGFMERNKDCKYYWVKI
ncbi:MAG: DUF2087 domain-containing protein [Firmicutes bacterium]|nr:DUF2087 domain-containing protein [Bacillota bacterium]